MPGPLDWHIVRFVVQPLALIPAKSCCCRCARLAYSTIKINETDFGAVHVRCSYYNGAFLVEREDVCRKLIAERCSRRRRWCRNCAIYTQQTPEQQLRDK
jgi:hypothetical protein